MHTFKVDQEKYWCLHRLMKYRMCAFLNLVFVYRIIKSRETLQHPDKGKYNRAHSQFYIRKIATWFILWGSNFRYLEHWLFPSQFSQTPNPTTTPRFLYSQRYFYFLLTLYLMVIFCKPPHRYLTTFPHIACATLERIYDQAYRIRKVAIKAKIRN